MVAGFVGSLPGKCYRRRISWWILPDSPPVTDVMVKNRLEGLPRQYEGLKSIFIMPLIGVLVTGADVAAG